ncbi:hypothetical protein HIMB11_00417 [Rhodobacteraceae bacterium HIMB11]|nr:hypothetical protein HIMB11_00417 [Rhodobacteraceae bacterium HIMB11]
MKSWSKNNISKVRNDTKSRLDHVKFISRSFRLFNLFVALFQHCFIKFILLVKGLFISTIIVITLAIFKRYRNIYLREILAFSSSPSRLHRVLPHSHSSVRFVNFEKATRLFSVDFAIHSTMSRMICTLYGAVLNYLCLREMYPEARYLLGRIKNRNLSEWKQCFSTSIEIREKQNLICDFHDFQNGISLIDHSKPNSVETTICSSEHFRISNLNDRIILENQKSLVSKKKHTIPLLYLQNKEPKKKVVLAPKTQVSGHIHVFDEANIDTARRVSFNFLCDEILLHPNIDFRCLASNFTAVLHAQDVIANRKPFLQQFSSSSLQFPNDIRSSLFFNSLITSNFDDRWVIDLPANEQVRKKKWTVLSGHGENYHHFLFEVIGSVILQNKKSLLNKKLTFASNSEHLKPWQSELFSYVLKRDKHEILPVNSEFHLGMANTQYVNSSFTSYPNPKNIVHPSIFSAIRECTISNNVPIVKGKRVAFFRNGNRGVEKSTEKKIKEILLKADFLLIDGANHTVTEQIALVRDAEIFCSFAGASFANAAFVHKNAKVIKIATASHFRHSFSSLVQLLNLKFYLILVDEVRILKNANPIWVNYMMKINVKNFERQIKSIIKE